MYKIGEFSKMTMLPVKTLRYYHEINLLEPVIIDEETGYRYYDGAAYERALQINLLKSLLFSLAEIKEVLDWIESDEDLDAFLAEKHEQLEQQMRSLKTVQKNIQSYRHEKEVLQMEHAYTFEQKEMSAQRVISIRYKGRYDEVGKYFGKLFKAAGSKVAGSPLCIYHDEGYVEEGADIEACLPVSAAVEKNGITCRSLNGGSFLSTVHIGPYEKLHNAYKAITDYANENDLVLHGPSREVYEKGPGMLLKGNPEKYRTLILFQVEKK